MIEQFRAVTKKAIGGSAKAMIVTPSRLHAVRYIKEFKAYIISKDYRTGKTFYQRYHWRKWSREFFSIISYILCFKWQLFYYRKIGLHNLFIQMQLMNL